MYTATAPTWRDIVLGKSQENLKTLILDAAGYLMQCADDRLAGADVRFEFSPEVFNLTEPAFVLDVCDSVSDLWAARPERPVVLNLPATVEVSTPNVYADQIEYMHRNLARRDGVILSVHPHNDRGTGIACAELAVLAGAQRVEGCLFGNGERTGNVDLVTLALNLYTQGVNPMIDFSDIDAVLGVVEECNRLPVHIRHPYAGALVHTAFSGTHQDAIAKGMARHRANAERQGLAPERAPWSVPYLPVDPADIGRTYEEVIRVNSQSGKGGMAHLLHTGYGLDLPADMRPDFYQVVQQITDETGQEVGRDDLWKLFNAAYLAPAYQGPYALNGWSTRQSGADHEFTATASSLAGQSSVRGLGAGPLDALADAFRQVGVTVDVLSYAEHAVASGSDAMAVAYVNCRINDHNVWAVGMDSSILAAGVQAVLAAVNRALASAG